MLNAVVKKTVSVLKKHFATIVIIVGLVLALVYISILFMTSQFKPTTEVRIGSGVYSLLLADTETELIQGLSGTESLEIDGGLLMDFGFDYTHGIWMKDMKYPLDLVWLDKSKTIVYVVRDAPPEDPVETVYSPGDNARYVIELPAGSIQKSDIKIGNKAEFNIDV